MKELAAAMELSEEEFRQQYSREFKEKDRPYSAYEHVARLKGYVPEKKIKEIKEGVDGVLRDTSRFLYPKAMKAVRSFKGGDNEVILLSIGNDDFQQAKIESCGIAPLFNKIIITRDKVERLNPWRKREFVFINDDPQENERVARYFPGAKVFPVGGDTISSYGLVDIISLWEQK